jgi:hypothetical protein
MGSRTGLDISENIKISYFLLGIEPLLVCLPALKLITRSTPPSRLVLFVCVLENSYIYHNFILRRIAGWYYETTVLYLHCKERKWLRLAKEAITDINQNDTRKNYFTYIAARSIKLMLIDLETRTILQIIEMLYNNGEPKKPIKDRQQ